LENSKKINEESQIPELYSKSIIGVFAMLFSAIFGAALLMYNLKKLNNYKGSIVVLIFGVLYTIGATFLLSALRNNSNLAILLNLGGAFLLTTFFWNKYIGKEYVYKPKKYWKLIIITLLIIALLVFLFLYGHLILMSL